MNCNSDRDTSCFIDKIYSNNFYPTINIPTRISSTSETLIDNIILSVSAGNLVTSILDHLMHYIFIPSEITEKPNNKIFKRKYTAENLKNIQIALDIGNKDTNNSFQISLQTIENLLDTFCLVTAILKRKQNLKLKVWITSALPLE